MKHQYLHLYASPIEGNFLRAKIFDSIDKLDEYKKEIYRKNHADEYTFYPILTLAITEGSCLIESVS